MVGQSIRLGSNLVLAWLLTPDAFGMAALAVTFFTGLVLMSDLGVEASLIRNNHADVPAFYNTAFTIKLIQGFLLFVVCLIFADPLAVFYQEPSLYDMIVLGGVGLFLQGSRSTSWPVLQRNMQIKRLAVYGLIAQVTGVAATIAYAIVRPEPIALIVGFVVSTAITTLISHLICRHDIKNKLAWDSRSFGEIFHFGKWIFISSTCSFLSQRSDRFILGKLASVDTLGVYHVAMMLADLPRFAIHIIAERLLYPLFAHYARQDIASLRRKYFLIRKVLLPTMLLTSLMIIIAADSFFFYLYKGSYHDAMWMAPCLMAMLWFDLLINSMDRVPVALGDSRLLASTWALILPVKIIFAYFGYIYFDIVGFIAGLAVGSIVGYLRLTFAARKIGFSSLYQDSKYTFVLLIVSAGYFGLKKWLGIPVLQAGIWFDGICLLVVVLCIGGLVISRIKALTGQVSDAGLS